MAKLIKRLCLPVGSYQREGETKPTIEYRDIGVVLEFERTGTGEKWQEVRLNLDVLNPQLFTMARAQTDRGSSTTRVKMFDAVKKAAESSKPEAPDSTTAPPGDDDIPF